MTTNDKYEHLSDLLATVWTDKPEMAAARVTNRAVELLSEARDASGIEQKQIAERLNVTNGRVSQIMSGEGNLYLTTLARYLAVMGYELQLEARPEHGGQEIGATRIRGERPGELTFADQIHERSARCASTVGARSESEWQGSRARQITRNAGQAVRA